MPLGLVSQQRSPPLSEEAIILSLLGDGDKALANDLSAEPGVRLSDITREMGDRREQFRRQPGCRQGNPKEELRSGSPNPVQTGRPQFFSCAGRRRTSCGIRCRRLRRSTRRWTSGSKPTCTAGAMERGRAELGVRAMPLTAGKQLTNQRASPNEVRTKPGTPPPNIVAA